MKSIIKKMLLIKIFFFSCCHIIYSQPYYFQHVTEYDSTYEIIFPEIIEKLDLSNNTVGEFISLNDNIIHQIYCDPTYSWMVIEVPYLDGLIYNINNPTIHATIPVENSGLGGAVLFSNLLNKVYYFDLRENLEILTSINVTTFEVDSILEINYSYNQTLGNQEAFFSSNQEIIYFSVADTLYSDTVNNQDYLTYFSTSINQIIQKTKLSTFGHPNADGYLLHRGSKGKAVVESFYKNENKECKFRVYDFDNNIGSSFINYSGYTTPYFYNNGEHLVLPETEDSVGFDYNTGKLFIYSFESTDLVKTIILPAGGEILTYDNYPNNMYYVKDIELPTRQIYTLKMDSILNVLDLTSLSPATKIVNSPPFTLMVNGHGFDTLSTVYFNGGAKTTTYISDSVLTASISTADISVVGNYTVWVTDEWGTSDTLMFAVTPQPADLSSLSPTIALTYDPLYELEYFTITVNGSNFDSSSVIYFGGYARTTTFVSSTVLKFQGRSYDVGVNAHTIPLWVSNGGAISDTLIFSVQSELIEGITPVFFCIDDKGGETITAHLSYNNPNTETIFIPIGTKNRLLPGWAGLPQMFYPGENPEEFTVEFDGNETVWELTRLETTFSKKSDPCE